MFNNRFFIEAGGLMSYGPNYSDQFRRAAELALYTVAAFKPLCACPIPNASRLASQAR